MNLEITSKADKGIFVTTSCYFSCSSLINQEIIINRVIASAVSVSLPLTYAAYSTHT